MRWITMAVAAMIVAAADAQDIEWTIIDVARQAKFAVTDARKKLAEGGILQAQPQGSDLALTVRYELVRGATRMTIHLADRSGKERGLVVRLSVPLSADGEWRWWRDLDTPLSLGEKPLANTAGLRGLPGLPYFEEAERPDYGRYSVYPLGVAQSGGRWIGLARLVGDLVLTRFAAVGGKEPRLSAEVDLALSEATRPPREAEFALWYLSGDGAPDAPGMRAALARYYKLKPDDFDVRVQQFGGWMPFSDLGKLPNVDEFGFAYQEGARNPAFDDALGALSFVYFHCAGEFANVPGYKRGTKPPPSYEQAVAAFNAVAEKRTGIEKVWDLCGIRGPDGKIAYRAEKVYGDLFCQACVDPDLPYGKAMADSLLKRVSARPFPEGIDGVYYDGIAAGLDYAPEHLKAADHLLLWDGKLGRPVNYNLWSSAEWARYIHDTLAGTGKLTMLNDGSLSSFAFVAPHIDVPGGEMSIHLSRQQARRIRALTSHKPFCTLVKADFSQFESAHIETYMRRCVAYGVLFGFFDITPSGAHPGSSYWLHPEWYDRDRPLFRRYMPLARELARAGWEPVPLARVEGLGAYVERFGPADEGALTYLTVSTDPRENVRERKPVVLRPSANLVARYKSLVAVELLTGRIVPARGEITAPMTGEDLAVWAIGGRSAQADACLARARDVLQRRERYVEACRSGDAALTPWGGYGDAGAKITSPGRESAYCLQAEKDKPGASAGASQTVVVNHDRPRKLVVSAWSRAENVTGDEDNDYSLYVDCYYTDGSAIYGQTVSFATGTHDWQHGERVIEPAKPIRNINVYLLFRGAHTGRVWFDDVRVALADEPETNLLPRGGFDSQAEGRAIAANGQQAQRIRDRLASLGKLISGDAKGVNWPRADELLADVERTAREADWGADTERTLRDVADLRWRLKLARICLSGRTGQQTPLRPSRLTELAALQTSRAATGPRQYRATTGGVPQGTIVTVDSNYPGYGAEPLTDGKINPKGAHWTKVAWASSDSAGPHWIELKLPRRTTVSEARIWWALDAGKLRCSRQAEVQVRKGGKWVRAEGQRARLDGEKGLTTVALPPQPVTALRIYQPPQGGSPDRPGLMWVTEVELSTD